MKRNVFILLIISFIFCQQALNAQVRYGTGINYSTWLNTPGVNLRVELGITDALAAVPMLDINLPRFSTWTLINGASLHLHYNVGIVEELDLYPLAGLTIKSYLDFDRYSSTFHKFSFNPTGGAGGKLKLSETFEVFAEGRLEIGRYSQFVGTIGILLRPDR